MRQLIKNARLVLLDRIEEGSLVVEDQKIAGITLRVGDLSHYDKVIDMGGRYLSSGFVEIHTHGAGGGDFMDGQPQAFAAAFQEHLAHGVTTLYPTLLAASREELEKNIALFGKLKPEWEQKGLTLPGLHLEGPYLNMEQKGAINQRYIRNPEETEYREMVEKYGHLLSRWTAAVELEGAYAFGDYLCRHGIRPSLGHSNAVFQQVKEGMLHGFTHITHLYSAMSTITRKGGFRYAGVLESAFCLPELTVEIIADGCHLPLELLKWVYEAKGPRQVALVTDSMRCAGQNVRESFLGSEESGPKVVIEDGVAKLMDRSAFAGSVATSDRLLRVMYHQAGIPLYDVVRMMTHTPATIMGIDGQKGCLAVGKDADLVAFDEGIKVHGVMSRGQGVWGGLC